MTGRPCSTHTWPPPGGQPDVGRGNQRTCWPRFPPPPRPRSRRPAGSSLTTLTSTWVGRRREGSPPRRGVRRPLPARRPDRARCAAGSTPARADHAPAVPRRAPPADSPHQPVVGWWSAPSADPPADQDHRPAAWQAVLPAAGLGRAGPGQPGLAWATDTRPAPGCSKTSPPTVVPVLLTGGDRPARHARRRTCPPGTRPLHHQRGRHPPSLRSFCCLPSRLALVLVMSSVRVEDRSGSRICPARHARHRPKAVAMWSGRRQTGRLLTGPSLPGWGQRAGRGAASLKPAGRLRHETDFSRYLRRQSHLAALERGWPCTLRPTSSGR